MGCGWGKLVINIFGKEVAYSISLFLMPITSEKRIKLFGNLPALVRIKADHQKSHESGFMQLDYEVKNS